jgi:hypothetical protein
MTVKRLIATAPGKSIAKVDIVQTLMPIGVITKQPVSMQKPVIPGRK